MTDLGLSPNFPGCCKGTEEDMYYKMKHAHLPEEACHCDVTGENLRGGVVIQLAKCMYLKMHTEQIGHELN